MKLNNGKSLLRTAAGISVIALMSATSAFAQNSETIAASDGADAHEDTPAMREVQDAVAGLLTLGYGRPQAVDAVAVARQALGETADTGALIRQALKQLSR